MNNNPPPHSEMENLLELLKLEQIDNDVFRGPITNEPWMRVFGGQVIGQALQAACETIENDRLPHSLHAYFLRPGDPKKPIIYNVERDRDGKSFSSRRVVAKQNGKPILNLACSFQDFEGGFHHQFDMPDVPPPESLKSELDLIFEVLNGPPSQMQDIINGNLEHIIRKRPIEFRPIDQERYLTLRNSVPKQCTWFKSLTPIPDNQILQRVLLAFSSDFFLLSTCLEPHAATWDEKRMQVASLDHAVWFHEDFRIDDWLLYVLDSPWAGGGRGMNRGLVYTRDGKLVASVAQEGLIRVSK